jgi:flavin reductase (DIM6/NTAB) family NADH-FMN oxidoreductase RutF
MMAIPVTPYAQRFLHPEAKFVLNVLTEGRTIRRHFAHQPQPGDNPFRAVAHYAGANGCLILKEALAYLECSIQRWIQCGDHWLVYAIVQAGDVLVDDGVTAVQQRTSGSQY